MDTGAYEKYKAENPSKSGASMKSQIVEHTATKLEFSHIEISLVIIFCVLCIYAVIKIFQKGKDDKTTK